MRLPSRDSIEGLRPISRNLSLDLIAAIGVGIAGALVSSLLPTIARRGGLEPLGLAVLAATPFLTNLLSIFSGRIGPQIGSPVRAVCAWPGPARSLILLFASPAVVIIAVALVFWISISFSSPFQLRLWGATLPGPDARPRGRVPGDRPGGCRGGCCAHRRHPGGPDRRAAGRRARRARGRGLLRSPTGGSVRLRPPRPAAYSARESIAAMRQRPTLGRVALAQGFFGGGFIAAGPLFALVNVDRLNLSLSDVGIIGVLSAVATTISFLVWGAVSDHVDVLAPMRFGSIIGLVGLFLYAVAPGRRRPVAGGDRDRHGQLLDRDRRRRRHQRRDAHGVRERRR